MLKVITLEEFIKLIENIKELQELQEEIIDIDRIYNRVLSKDIISPCDLPGFNRSSVDGYAVKANDTYLCSDSMPSVLKLLGEVKIGEIPPFVISEGEAVYIPTGGMLPSGADAVVMIEDSEDAFNEVLINKPVAKGENLVMSDEDVVKNEVLLKKGTTIKPHHIGVLAGIGVTEVCVKEKIKIGIVSTGDELVSPYSSCPVPKVRDINGFYLKSAVEEDGCEGRYYGIVSDNKEKLNEVVKVALNENNIVLISGGSSAGNKDFTIDIMERHGKVLFHGLAIKPGKPTLMSECNGKYIIGLPGHPLSCAVVYKFIVKKILDKMYGRITDDINTEGTMGVNYHKARGREEYLPVKIEEGVIYPLYAKSSAISVLSKADGFIKLPRDCEGIEKGEKIIVMR
ncbi:hypothetical protein Q428_08515 [Fervidicella metallireducens AeB]|uniref:Molybdopterin molybdenumtransferase n=1 Tax=Fervidicella metallireducens AeB TaxID=1403537 RepID=A0A017RUP3_9CLOT|nr:molybdenum cofactor synthesis domain-containing protein [Fervidicella metallireducens]EYE88341.1 hypothetical protein Q428_08515 [Fervidicella metallireducens AeB]